MTKKAAEGTDSTYSQWSADWPEESSAGKGKGFRFEVSVFCFQIETGFVNRRSPSL